MKKKILVTGGTGYIGSHTAVELLNKGYEVFIIDNLSNSSISVIDGIEKITGIKPHFEKIDLTDRKTLGRYFNTHHDIDAVIHFAAFKSVTESVSEPLKYYHNNLNSLANILAEMARVNITALVFSSSCTVYGQPDKLPVKEDAPLKPALSPYGNTKRICEEIIRDVINSRAGLSCVSLRYFNPIGAHPSSHIGELPTGIPNNLVPYITQTAAGIREKLHVFGDDYNTADGSCIRDYINIVDLAGAHVSALGRLSGTEHERYEVFNIGTGKGISVFEAISEFEKATGVKIKFEISQRRKGDIEKVWADPSKANNILGWKAEKNISETMADAWNWEKKYRGIN